MAIIKCKMCGGDIQLAEDKTFGTCEYCGSVMTLPKISDDQRAAAFNRGNHFRRMGEFDKALAVYERIVAEDDDDAEAHWCCALCRFGIEYVEDPATYEWLPTCHRASFDSFLEDVDYLAAVEHSDGITRRQYQKDAAKIAEVQRGILATSQNTEPYDVFISYKELDAEGNRTRDSILAQDIYYQLTEKGWRVFFSRISLEDVPGTQYEPYIFAALNSAKVMIVVGTSAENLNAVWVKNEWSRYLSLMRKDRSKLLLPCYRDMDPYDLPEQLSVLMSYDMGKIGFIQDLIRGVDKVLNAEKPKEAAPAPASAPVQERVIVQQTGGGPNVTALLKRGQQALEDEDWDKARGFYDQVLSMDAENAEAFLGLALAGSRSRDTQAYLNGLSSITPSKETRTLNLDMVHRKTVIENSVVPGYCDESELSKFYDFKVNYPSVKNSQQSLVQEARARFDSDRNLNRAFRYASGESKQRLDALKKELNDRLNAQIKAALLSDQKALEQAKAELAAKTEAADRRAEELSRAAQEKREADYQTACKLFEAAIMSFQFKSVANNFDALKDYRDSAKKKQEALEQAKDIEEAEQKAAAKAAAEAAAAAERAKRKRRRTTAIISAVLLACAALAVIFVTVTLPKLKLNKAIELMNSGDYEAAYALLEEIGNSDAIAASKSYRAVAYIDSGDYEAAYTLLEELGDSETIVASKYDRAAALIDSGDYEAAYDLLKGLNYKDSASKLSTIKPMYQKILFSKAQVGSYVYFGSYEQDNNTVNGKEDIEWQVLAMDGDRFLLISRYALDCQQYNSSYTDVTWETCSLRKWLNDTFLSAAFSEEERAMIPSVTVSADKNPSYSTSPGNSTRDQVFLLSITEMNKYFSSDIARQCQGTAYCYAQGLSKVRTVSFWLWLRSPGYSSSVATFVDSDGPVNDDGINVTNNLGAVRPAMWIDLGE